MWVGNGVFVGSNVDVWVGNGVFVGVVVFVGSGEAVLVGDGVISLFVFSVFSSGDGSSANATVIGL